MSKTIFDDIIKQHLEPVQIPNRENFIWDIQRIQNSVTGRINVSIANSFILESANLLFNAILTFEQGLFDCAYYSLRQAIELSTTMVYLSDMPQEIRTKKLKDWNADENFPNQNNMIEELKQKGNVLSDMKQKMPQFFSNLRDIYRTLNKLVHKQGMHRFYRYNFFHPVEKTQQLNNFISYLEQTIGIVSIMRLSIDPFPVLLLDEEIYHRIFETITDSYPQEFIDKYIGNETIKEYKQTDLFKGTYQSIMKLEKRDPCVSDIVWNQFIDFKQDEKINQQLHLISAIDQIAVYLAFACQTTTRVYTFLGIREYFTPLLPSDMDFNIGIRSSAEFNKYANSPDKYNQPFDRFYISAFKHRDDDFLVEHLKPLSQQDIDKINKNLQEI